MKLHGNATPAGIPADPRDPQEPINNNFGLCVQESADEIGADKPVDDWKGS
jgi:hypothetical protein